MTIAPHLLTGSALAYATTDNIFVAFLLGFLVHFLLDSLPHIDPGSFHDIKIPGTDVDIELGKVEEKKPWPLWIYIFATCELVLVWLLVIGLFRNRSDFNIIVAGGLGGISVDLIDNGGFPFVRQLPVIRELHWFHKRVHHDLDLSKWYWGVLVQAIIAGGSLWYLLKF